MKSRENFSARFQQLCPSELDEALALIDACEFNERPPYAHIHALISDAMRRLEVDEAAPLDWEVGDGRRRARIVGANARARLRRFQLDDAAVLHRAHFVGELGQSHLASLRMRERDQAALDDNDEPRAKTPPIDAPS